MNKREQTYHALSVAAERMGKNGYRAAVARLKKRGGKPVAHRKRSIYNPTPAHRDVVDAMEMLACGDMSPEDAMSLLWRGDVMKERLGD